MKDRSVRKRRVKLNQSIRGKSCHEKRRNIYRSNFNLRHGAPEDAKKVTFIVVAENCAKRGWHVIPLHTTVSGSCSCVRKDCHSPGKHPNGDLAPNGLKDATTDLKIIRRWWREEPLANIGIRTGEVSGLLVLDIDIREAASNGNDKDGFADLKLLEQKYGPLPKTLFVKTPSGGKHLYFKYPTGVDIKSPASQIAPGIDIRANGAYVVAPPSVANGHYRMCGGNTPIAQLPDVWIKALTRKPRVALRNCDVKWDDDTKQLLDSALEFIPADEYNLWIKVGMAVHNDFGGNRDGLEGWMKWSATCPEKYSEEECRKKWQSFAGYEGEPVTLGTIIHEAKERGWKATSISTDDSRGKKSSRRIETTCMADVIPQELSWLWPWRIPQGKVTLIAGDPGLGKSLLSLMIAAHISTGKPWPIDDSQCPMGDVLLISAEDDPADTIRPRLEAAGADLKRIEIINGVCNKQSNQNEQVYQYLSLSKDIATLDKHLADKPECKLLIIDPITAYLGNIDSHKNADMRAMFSPLAKIASDHQIAIIGITHLNKSTANSAIFRPQGSIAVIAAARSAFLIAKDSDEPERRMLLPMKNNLARDSSGLAYRIESNIHSQPVIEWESEPVQESADEILKSINSRKQTGKLSEAAKWLRELLSDGPINSNKVRKSAENAGFSWATILRAKKLAEVEVVKGKGSARSQWSWKLKDQK